MLTFSHAHSYLSPAYPRCVDCIVPVVSNPGCELAELGHSARPEYAGHDHRSGPTRCPQSCGIYRAGWDTVSSLGGCSAKTTLLLATRQPPKHVDLCRWNRDYAAAQRWEGATDRRSCIQRSSREDRHRQPRSNGSYTATYRERRLRPTLPLPWNGRPCDLHRLRLL